MLKLKIRLLLLLSILAVTASAQVNSYKFKRNITGVNSVWHSFVLPDALFKNAKEGLEDLRIWGFKGKDTIEIPYLLKQRADVITNKEISCEQINQSRNSKGFYYTFKSPEIDIINQIELNFKQSNFDWRVALEGSNNNKEWFSILDNYRILSIESNDTKYQFTKLRFPNSKYQYFRIAIKSPIQPNLSEAKITKVDTIKGIDQKLKFLSFNIKEDAINKETIAEISLAEPTPVSYLKLHAQSRFDFYRSIKIDFATDSIKTAKGIEYDYANIYEGTVSSLEKTEYNFPNTLTSRLKITIQNKDNRPLRLSTLELKGNIYEMIARFDTAAFTYALYYGNKDVTRPSYDIEKFESKIPATLKDVSIGDEQKNPAYNEFITPVEKPLFKNKIWLWFLMGVIIALLGWFSLRMLKEA